MKKLLVLLLLIIVPAVCASGLTDLRLQKSSDDRLESYFDGSLTNLTTYYDYTDGLLNVLQDWHGNITFNGEENTTMPQSIARWTMDYNALGPNKTRTNPTNAITTGACSDTTSYYDDNWATETHVTAGTCTMYLNYTKPIGSTNATWHVKDSGGESLLTITPDCFNDMQGRIDLRARSVAAVIDVYWECRKDNGVWTILRTDGTDVDVYEETVHFHYSGDKMTNAVFDMSTALGQYHGQQNNMFEDGTVLYIGFEDTNGTHTFDWTPYSHVGSFLNGINISTQGHIGMGGEWDRSDDILDIENHTSLNDIFDNGGTVSAWVYPLGLGEGDNGRIVDKRGSTYAGWGTWISTGDASAGKLNFALDGGTGDAFYRSTDSIIPFDEWTHLSVTFNSSNNGDIPLFYVNGDLVSTTQLGALSGGAQSDYRNDIYIGQSVGATSLTWDGYMDEIYLSNRTLQQTEIARLKNHSCHAGYCYDFDGLNDAINISSTPALPNAYTVSLWFNPAGLGENDKGYLIYSNRNAINCRMETSSRINCFGPATTNLDKANGYLNTWNHFLMTYNGTEQYCYYLDGELSICRNLTADVPSAANYTTLGDNREGTRNFNGSIDDVRVWDVALSAEQVRIAYDGGFYTTNLMNGTYQANMTWRNGTTTETNTSEKVYVFNASESIAHLNLDDCSTHSFEFLGIDVWHEDIPNAHLISDMDIAGTFWYGESWNGPTYNRTLSLNLSNYANYTLCREENKSMFADIYIRYAVTDGFTHRHYFVNHSFNTGVQNVSLYNYNYTTGLSDFDGEIRKISDYSIFSNIITSLQRLYIDDGNVWRTIQMDESGEFGKVFFNIREADTDYRLRFMRRSDQSILKTTDPLKFVCESGVCSFVIEIPDATATASTKDLNTTISYDATAGMINITWDDPTGVTSSVTWTVTKETLGGTLTLCSGTQTGSAGSTNCSVAGITGTVFVRVFAAASPLKPFTSAIYSLNTTGLWNVLQDEGYEDDAAFWAFAILTTLVIGGIVIHPAVGIALLVFGGVIIGMLGLFSPWNMTVTIIIAIMAFILFPKMKSRLL